jgi:predicted anti-sigma-YlaC factor YlaD
MTDRDRCAEVADLLPEVATGAATGPDRARVLRHLAGCARCRQELEELARTADELLPLVPEREPPVGFEEAVLARLAAPAAEVRPLRKRHLALAAACVIMVAALAAGLVWWRTAPDRRLAEEYRQTLVEGDGSYLRAAALSTGSSTVGHLYAYQGRPSWIYVTVTDAPAPGRYEVRLTAKDGRQWRLGECVVTRRYCGAGATITIPVDDISAVRLDIPGGSGMVAKLQ